MRPLCQAGFVGFLVAILLAFLIARSLSFPLDQIATASEGMARGDYEQQLPLAGPAEVQRAAHSFNQMAAEVKQNRQIQRDFVANVSHDLKTPLTSIRGWSQSLLDGTADTPAQQERAATIIHHETERMSRMVSQLLDLARLESGQLKLLLKPTDLNAVLQQVHQNMALRATETGIHLTIEVESTLPAVPADYDRFLQVITNLVDNALTHTPSGGRVHLSSEFPNPHVAVLKVQDTGRGIPTEDLTRIFERFYQVDKSRRRHETHQGTGLGLAIVKELVEAHHGRITAHSLAGKGSLFTIRLPVGPKEQETTMVSRRDLFP